MFTVPRVCHNSILCPTQTQYSLIGSRTATALRNGQTMMTDLPGTLRRTAPSSYLGDHSPEASAIAVAQQYQPDDGRTALHDRLRTTSACTAIQQGCLSLAVCCRSCRRGPRGCALLSFNVTRSVRTGRSLPPSWGHGSMYISPECRAKRGFSGPTGWPRSAADIREQVRTCETASARGSNDRTHLRKSALARPDHLGGCSRTCHATHPLAAFAARQPTRTEHTGAWSPSARADCSSRGGVVRRFPCPGRCSPPGGR